jgi:hypothetical protein
LYPSRDHVPVLEDLVSLKKLRISIFLRMVGFGLFLAWRLLKFLLHRLQFILVRNDGFIFRHQT